jgi:hypothetical protein
MFPWGDLQSWVTQFFDDQNNSVFLRPSAGNKLFAGQVVSFEEWDKKIKLIGFYGIEPEELIIAAPVQQIDNEWRLVVVDKKIVSSTQYKKVMKS